MSEDPGLIERLGEPVTFDEATDRRLRRVIAQRLEVRGEKVPEGLLGPQDDGVVLDLGPERRGPSGAGGRSWFWAAAAAAVVVIIVGLVLATAPGDGAQPTVQGYADAVGRGEHLVLGPDELLRTATEQEVPGVDAQRWVQHLQIDGSGFVEVTEPDGSNLRRIEYGPGELGLAGFSYQQLQDLPTESAALSQAIAEQTGSTDVRSLVRSLAELLGTTATPTDVRAGAMRLLGTYGAVADDEGGPHVVVADGDGRLVRVDLDLDAGVATAITIEDEASGTRLEQVRYLGDTLEDG